MSGLSFRYRSLESLNLNPFAVKEIIFSELIFSSFSSKLLFVFKINLLRSLPLSFSSKQ